MAMPYEIETQPDGLLFSQDSWPKARTATEYDTERWIARFEQGKFEGSWVQRYLRRKNNIEDGYI